jgi:hypothetical protein
VVVVTPVNRPPTLDPINSISIYQNSEPVTLTLTGITSGAANENQPLFVSASSSNPALVPDPIVNYNSPNSVGSLSLAPLPDVSGAATITVTVFDGSIQRNTVSRSFTVTVNPVPATFLSISSGAGQVVVSWSRAASGYVLQSVENSGLWAGVVENPVQVGNRFYVTNSAVDATRFYRLFKSSGP